MIIEENKIQNGLLAWSNGKEVKIHKDYMYLIEDEFKKRLERQEDLRVKQDVGSEEYSRRLSREYERYGDELWEIGMHVKGFVKLMEAATMLLGGYRRWINRRVTSWYHPNLKQFRRLHRRCLERVREDARMEELFAASEVSRLFERMEEEYAGCDISYEIKLKDWALWDALYHWDGDDPLCD